jgi:hypothetical protein
MFQLRLVGLYFCSKFSKYSSSLVCMHDDSTLLGIFIRDEYYITDDLLSYTK